MEVDLDDASDSDGNESRSSSDQVPDYDDASGEAVVSFDTSLPGAHTYLGQDLEDVRGRTVLDDWSCRVMPLLSFTGLVLMPGQTLPLNVSEPRTLAVIKQALGTDHTLGVIHLSFEQAEPGMHRLRCAAVGTTAEVCSVKEDLDEPSGVSVIRAKAVGRQRFKVLKKWRQIDGVLMASIRILPERTLPSAMARLASCCGQRTGGGCAALWRGVALRLPGADAATVDAAGVQATRVSKRKVVERCLAFMTSWPSWVYDMYDEEQLMARVRRQLRRWSGSMALLAESLPQSDPGQFSFSVASSLPLDEPTRLQILCADSATQRLRIELGLLEKCTSFVCSSCGKSVTSTSDVFSLAREGPMAAYVNSYGHVHETLTVLRAKNLLLSGRSSLENTWFPGYAWTIANCSTCGGHKGWKFTARQADLHPVSFWGLTRAGLVPKLVGSDEQTDEPTVTPT